MTQHGALRRLSLFTKVRISWYFRYWQEVVIWTGLMMITVGVIFVHDRQTVPM